MTDEPNLGETESQHLAERRAKLERLRERGVEPFPHAYPDRVEIADVRSEHEGLGEGEETDTSHRVAGRITARRGHGKAAFLDLRDGSGQIQIHARADVLGDDEHERLVGLDLGDIVGDRGGRVRDQARRAQPPGRLLGCCSQRACARRRRSSTGSRTSRPATASASST